MTMPLGSAPGRRWTSPALVALAVAVLLAAVFAGIDRTRTHQTASGAGPRHWPSGVGSKATRSLAHIHWELMPVGAEAAATHASTDEGAVVDAAYAQMGSLEPSHVETVTLVSAADRASTSPRSAAATPSPTWVIEFHAVRIPNLSGTGPDETADMVALVSADSLKFLLARSE